MSNSQVLISFSAAPSPEQISDWWSNLKHAESVRMDSWDDAIAWAETRDGYLDGPPGGSVKAIFKNGNRWVLADFSLLMFDSQLNLSKASTQIGPIYLAMTQGTAGCAGFQAYADGHLVRSIDYIEGAVSVEGTALPEEAGITLANLYDRELNRLWVRFGHDGLLFDCEPKGVTCMHFIDADEIGSADVPPIAPIQQKPQSPWWKLW